MTWIPQHASPTECPNDYPVWDAISATADVLHTTMQCGTKLRHIHSKCSYSPKTNNSIKALLPVTQGHNQHPLSPVFERIWVDKRQRKSVLELPQTIPLHTDWGLLSPLLCQKTGLSCEHCQHHEWQWPNIFLNQQTFWKGIWLQSISIQKQPQPGSTLCPILSNDVLPPFCSNSISNIA